MISKLQSVALSGLECETIDIEVDLSRGKHSFYIVGLAAKEVAEAKERIPSAIKNSGYKFPKGRAIVNLAPADLRKEGVAFDVPIALGIISYTEKIPNTAFDGTLFLGQLSLDGKLKPITGVLSIAEYSKSKNITKIFVPEENVREASMIDGLEIYGFSYLSEIVEHLVGESKKEKAPPFDVEQYLGPEMKCYVDMFDIKGQEAAKRAMEIAAAGSHNMLMCGAPGSGKTLLAKALPGILPQMTREEMLEVTRIYSVAGLLPEDTPLIVRRPFRVVHHSASGASIVGGGRIAKPGEITLAHRGALFLDEFAEFSMMLTELLRQPLEDKQITVSRVAGSITYPAQFVLVAAMNPCKCGYYNVSHVDKECSCSAFDIAHYQKKISGPILDRFDLYSDIAPVAFKKLTRDEVDHGEKSSVIQGRVQNARDIQNRRFSALSITCNAEMSLKEVKEFCSLDDETLTFLEQAVNVYQLSARGYHRIIKVARTIADLEKSEQICKHHAAEALQYRKKNAVEF